MRNDCCKKALVVGVIFLFIGVGVQPVFAKNTIKTTSETLEDCECQPISNHNLNRLEKLSILSKNNPEISEKFEELSNRITTLKEINEKLFTPPLIICGALLVIMFNVYAIGVYFGRKGITFENLGFDIIAIMFYAIGYKIIDMAEQMLAFIFDELGCEPWNSGANPLHEMLLWEDKKDEERLL